MNVLVIETAFLGDTILSLALAEEIKRLVPNTSVTYLVRPEAVEITACCPFVDCVIPFDKRGEESGINGIARKAKELNDGHFDRVYLLHTSHRSKKLLSRLQIKEKIGYTEASSLLTNVIPEEPLDSRVMRALRLLTPHHKDVSFGILPTILPPQFDITLPSDPFVTIAPGSIWKTKEWGHEKFEQLCGALTDIGYPVAMLGTQAEAAFGDNLQSAYKNVINFCGKTTLPESAFIISKSKVLISNDSAPMHLALAVRTPHIALFGPTVPEFGFAPKSAFSQIIELPELWCRPCTTHGSQSCPIHTHECMTEIGVERVFEAVQYMLGQTIGMERLQ